MIDTICLLIPKENMMYLSGVSDWELYSRTEQYEKYVRNPSKAEKLTGKYFPRLTGYKRHYSQNANVRIEFSIPKLLFLNNLDELEDADFPKVIDTLQERLKLMGVRVLQPILENAPVSSVHFSKNIPLENGYTSTHIISELGKINLRKNFDFARTRFINDGQSLYAHPTAHQMVIYDKIADLNKDKKRSIDKDQPLYQRSLFEQFTKETEQPEILRIEIRLNHKQKLNKLLTDFGYKPNPVFKQIFKTEISKRVVIDYWERLVKKRNLGLFSMTQSPKDILQTLFLADKEIKPKQAVYLFGLHLLSKDENGMRQLRTIISKRSRDRTWYRIAKDIQQSSELITKNKLRNWVSQIDNSLNLYKTYKINYYEKN
jgi:hypothetical protein